MKAYLFLLAITTATGVYAQHHEGTVVYDVSVKLRIGPPGSPVHGYTQAFELIYNSKASLYSHLPQAVPQNEDLRTGQTVLRPQNNTITYFDFAGGNIIEQRELPDGLYLIREPIEKLEWTITGEEKSLLGHTVIKAIAYSLESSFRTTMENGVLKRETLVDTSRLEAWFAPSIPVPAGPGEIQGQLPGLVLELRYDNDRRVILAKEINPRAKTARLKEPTKGKLVSRVEFQKAMEQQVAASQRFMQGQQIQVQRDQ